MNKIFKFYELQFCAQSRKPNSIQFSRSVMSNSLQLHELQHAGLPVYHQLWKSTQTHVPWLDDAIQPSHPLSSVTDGGRQPEMEGFPTSDFQGRHEPKE